DTFGEIMLNGVYPDSPLPLLVILDLSASPRVDLQSAYTLASMADELTVKGIRFQAVEPRSSVRDRLRHEGLDLKLGHIDRFTTIADVIDHFQRDNNAASLRPNEPHSTE